HYPYILDYHSFPTRRSSDLDRYLGTMPRCRSTVSDLRFPQLFLIVAGILIQLRVILHILALIEIFLEAPRLAALIRLWLDVARKDRKSTRLNSSHVKISYAV